MDKSDHAVQQFQGGLNCAQAVFGEFAESHGLDWELAVKVAAGFGGGMGLGDTCGAVAGGIMAIGLSSAPSNPQDVLAKARTGELVQSFLGEFTARHGSLMCCDLLDCGPDFPEALREAKALGFMETKCAVFVRDAVQILDGLLWGG